MGVTSSAFVLFKKLGLGKQETASSGHVTHPHLGQALSVRSLTRAGCTSLLPPTPHGSKGETANQRSIQETPTLGKSLSHYTVFQSLRCRQRTLVYLSVCYLQTLFKRQGSASNRECVWILPTCVVYTQMPSLPLPGTWVRESQHGFWLQSWKTALEKSLGTCQSASKELSVSSLSSHDWECTHIIEGSLVARGPNLVILEGFCTSEHLDQKARQRAGDTTLILGHRAAIRVDSGKRAHGIETTTLKPLRKQVRIVWFLVMFCVWDARFLWWGKWCNVYF